MYGRMEEADALIESLLQDKVCVEYSVFELWCVTTSLGRPLRYHEDQFIAPSCLATTAAMSETMPCEGN